MGEELNQPAELNSDYDDMGPSFGTGRSYFIVAHQSPISPNRDDCFRPIPTNMGMCTYRPGWWKMI
jgi:hypothetical protein